MEPEALAVDETWEKRPEPMAPPGPCATCLGRGGSCKDCRGKKTEPWAWHYLFGDPAPVDV